MHRDKLILLEAFLKKFLAIKIIQLILYLKKKKVKTLVNNKIILRVKKWVLPV